MARRRGTSRVTRPGEAARTGDRPPAPGLPSIRQRRPVLFWGLMVAVFALVLPLIFGFVQALS